MKVWKRKVNGERFLPSFSVKDLRVGDKFRLSPECTDASPINAEDRIYTITEDPWVNVYASRFMLPCRGALLSCFFTDHVELLSPVKVPAGWPL